MRISRFNYRGMESIAALFDDTIRLQVGGEVYIYDLEGRPIFLYLGNRLYVRGLTGVIVEKKWISIRPRRRLLNRVQDGDQIIKYVQERIGEIHGYIGDRSISRAIDRILSRGPEWLDMDASIFRRIYRPISILPPDQYLSLVFQPVEGCPYNRCAFCTFYRDRVFRLKDIDEFIEHVSIIRRQLGLGYRVRRRVFLGDANALIAPTDRLMKYIGVIGEKLDMKYVEGFYSFIDYFHRLKSGGELDRLRDAGLKRVYVGLESGSRELLRLLNKPGEPTMAVRLVNRFKRHGINVGVIILVGAGGYEYYDEHLRDTLRVVSLMDLGKGDIIYLSRLKVAPGSPYHQLIREGGVTELSKEDLDRQVDDFVRHLKAITSRDTVIAEYDIDEFVY